MKFEVAAMIPGFANSCQYWTVPAKSIQSVPRSGMPHVCAASARFGAKPIAAQAASAMTSSLLKDPSSKVAGSAGGIEPPALPSSYSSSGLSTSGTSSASVDSCGFASPSGPVTGSPPKSPSPRLATPRPSPPSQQISSIAASSASPSYVSYGTYQEGPM